MRTTLAILALFAAIGCGAAGGNDVSAEDMAKVRSEFSQENYEKAMIAAGRGAELEREKQAAANRGEQ